MKIYCTTCCKEKTETPELCPAIDRYISPRINAVYQQSKTEKVPFRILSGEYGLLKPEDPIPWYDKKLEFEMIPLLLPIVSKQIKSQQIESILFFAKDATKLPEWLPYYKILELACAACAVNLKVELI